MDYDASKGLHIVDEENEATVHIPEGSTDYRVVTVKGSQAVRFEVLRQIILQFYRK